MNSHDKQIGSDATKSNDFQSDNNNSKDYNMQAYPFWKFWKKKRVIVTILLFLGLFVLYVLRANVSIAIVAMTEERIVQQPNGSIIIEEPEFMWNSREKGYILSSFFYGYILTQIPGGYLTSKFPCNIMFAISIGGSAIFTIATPLALSMGMPGFIFIRVVIGLLEGLAFPAVTAIISRWSPPNERTRMFSISYAGSQMGTVSAMPLCAYLAEEVGWQSVFYIPGIIGVLWMILFYFVVAEDPTKDKRISAEEVRYIGESIEIKSFDNVQHPWKLFFITPCIWAAYVMHFCENWGFYTFLTQLPSFLKDGLGYSLFNTGFLSALPYLGMSVSLVVSSWICDMLLERKLFSATGVRKVCVCISFIGQTSFLCLTANIQDPAASLGLVVTVIFFAGFAWSTIGAVYQDLAPQHAHILFGISNTFATIPGILSPIITGEIVQNGTFAEWSQIFYIGAGLYIFGTITAVIWSKSELQPWAEQKPEQNPVGDDGNDATSKITTLEKSI